MKRSDGCILTILWPQIEVTTHTFPSNSIYTLFLSFIQNTIVIYRVSHKLEDVVFGLVMVALPFSANPCDLFTHILNGGFIANCVMQICIVHRPRICYIHDDLLTWKHYWPFGRGIHLWLLHASHTWSLVLIFHVSVHHKRLTNNRRMAIDSRLRPFSLTRNEFMEIGSKRDTSLNRSICCSDHKTTSSDLLSSVIIMTILMIA